MRPSGDDQHGIRSYRDDQRERLDGELEALALRYETEARQHEARIECEPGPSPLPVHAVQRGGGTVGHDGHPVCIDDPLLDQERTGGGREHHGRRRVGTRGDQDGALGDIELGQHGVQRDQVGDLEGSQEGQEEVAVFPAEYPELVLHDHDIELRAHGACGISIARDVRVIHGRSEAHASGG